MIIWIYARPLWQAITAILVLPFIRALFDKVVGRFNPLFILIAVGAIIYTTLFRSTVSNTGLILVPFYAFKMAKEQREIYRELIMNVLLFEPFGMCVSFGLKKNQFKRTVLLALCFSIVIEIIQYLFKLGLAEIDDVLANTLGAAIGATAYLICKKGSRTCSQTSMKE